VEDGEGRRQTNWLTEKVIKYHRTMATYVNAGGDLHSVGSSWSFTVPLFAWIDATFVG
jgi:hypothetical protein